MPERLSDVRVPTLVVWGEKDAFLSPRHGEAFAAAMPQATLAIVEDCGHLVPFERAEAFAAMALGFLQRRP